MHGEYRRSIPQKLLLIAGQLTLLYLAFWLLFGGGIELTSAWAGSARLPGDPLRRLLLLSFIVCYLLRSAAALTFFVKRAIGWGEALGVLLFLAVCELVFIIVGGVNGRHLTTLDYIAVALYFLGSWINTEAEFERFLFKRDPANHGRLFTGGLFRYAMHINYFGEFLLFAGFALLTGDAWTLLIPAVMLAGFVFIHIPALDRHLAARHAEEFRRWAENSRHLIPFLY